MVLLAVLLIALAAGSCSSSDNAADDPSPTPTQSPESEVETAYVAYWEMADRLAETPDPEDPELQRRASGEALTELRQGLASLEAAGQKLDVGQRTAHVVTDTKVDDGSTASLTDCDVDDSRLVGPGGETLDEDITTTLWDVRLIKSGGGWRVDRFVRIDSWDGETECE